MSRHAVFVHGMWSRPDVWNAWVAAFEKAGYACDAIALPGHGLRDRDSELAGLGIADYVDAVLSAIAAYDRPVLVGHSMGGLIAQLVAARADLAAAVLLNGAAPAPIFPLRPKMLPGLVRHFSWWNLWRSAFHLNAWEADYLLLGGLPEAERRGIRERLIGESGRIAYELGFGSFNRARTNYVDAKTVRCRILALAGGRDRIVPIDVSRSMAHYYGDGMTFREYPDRAHWILGEPGYERRIFEVLAWLSELETAARPA